MKQPAVYILTNQRNGTPYTGVTSDLAKRIWRHRTGATRGFTAIQGCKYLVWFELCETMISVIEREKQIKAGSRIDKLRMIEAINPAWRDLYNEL